MTSNIGGAAPGESLGPTLKKTLSGLYFTLPTMPPVTFTLTEAERRTLGAVARTLVPALEPHENPQGVWARDGDLRPLFDALEVGLSAHSPDQQAEFRRLMALFDSPLVALTRPGLPLRPFRSLNPEQQERLLEAWAFSVFGPMRRAFQALKRPLCFLLYTLTDATGHSSIWPALGYPGPLSPPPERVNRLPLLSPQAEQVLSCDTVVVGSGAGGGVVAGELAEAGHDVIVIEKGPYVAEDGYTQRELEMTATLYEARGTLATADLGVSVLAGSALGGGTTVNWAASLRPPPELLEEWAVQHRLPHLRTNEFARSIDAVAEATHVTRDESARNPQNEALWRGAVARGASVTPVTRNVRGCETRPCGYCGMGCQAGAKQGVLKTYLGRAATAGARLLADTTVERVLIERGTAVGVTATHRTAEGAHVPLTIRARRVVVAAGAIHTPALLRRSGLTHSHLGRHLKLHPVVTVAALYRERMEPWLGVMLSAMSDAWAHLTGPYGVRVETPPLHPGLVAIALPWRSGEEHKRLMARVAHIGAFMVLTRDRDGGSVTVDARGQPRLHYRQSRFDRAHMLRGIREAAHLHRAAGAECLVMPHNRHLLIELGTDAALDASLRDLESWGWGPNQFTMFSAHQMGTCRMGGDARRYPLTPEQESREVRELFVTDASVFPASSGVNPMLTIQALAHYAAQGIKSRA